MKIDINNVYDFLDYARKYDICNKFSNDGLRSIYDFFEELYDEEDYTINAVELALYYDEYENIDEYYNDYYNEEEINSFKTVSYTIVDSGIWKQRIKTNEELINDLIDEGVIIATFNKYFDLKDSDKRIIVFKG